MIGHNAFFKQSPITDMRVRQVRPAVMPHNNYGVRPSVGHPRYGFQTMLNQDSFGKLPMAPAIVGGNVDWTKMKVSPATQHLQSVLASRRSMSPATSVGSDLKLREPNVNSIHNTM